MSPQQNCTALRLALGLTAALGAATPAARAQQADASPMLRVEITGSSIKRIDGETALPVQIITREDIDRSGATTASELLKKVSANTAPLSDGVSITDGTSGQRGFNGANLRGLGVSSTLILLNGRRLANFASPGDNAGVDLNNIPSGAIQRVEILKDGASAIYGTDAIGGVINFITRRDYRGVDVNASALATQHGGAGKRTASVSAGHGDFAKDGFNVFGVLDVQKLDAMRSGQRAFIRDRPLATTLPAQMSGNAFPANMDISSAQREALIAAGLLPAGTTTNRINPSAPACNPPATVYAPQSPGGVAACGYDYMRDTEIYPEDSKVGFIGRATFQLSPAHQVFAEVMHSVAKSRYVMSPNPQRLRNLPIALLPEPYRKALTSPDLPDTFSGVRYRMSEAGNRTSEVNSTGQRLLLGASGTLAGWDYDVAASRAENRAVDKYVDGYVLFDQFYEAVRAGLVNPLGPSGQAGLDLLKRIKVNDEARKSKGVSNAVDAKLSKGLLALGGGDLALAVGAELRWERTTFTPSALLLSNNIGGDRDSTGAPDLGPSDDKRTVRSVFAEINAPFSKDVEMQLAARHDRYSEVGATTNPKIGLRWQPAASLLLRGSAGTGFRAPSLTDLKRPVIYGSASGYLTDPQCVSSGLDTIEGCTDQYAVERRSNPRLKPEKSRQFTLGAVLDVSKQLSLSVDYWNIKKEDVISTLGEQIIVDSPDKYNDRYIKRDEDGYISSILLQKENQGVQKTSGLDLGLNYRGAAGRFGSFSADLSGTLILKYERQFGALENFRSNLGLFLNDQAIQKWRHHLSFGWDMAPFNLTLSNDYSSGYTDQNTTYDPASNKLLPARRVKAYSLWDLTGSWDWNKNLKLRAGVLNLADTDPPFSNQGAFFLVGFDPTYTDPRGRSFFVSANYAFK
ncbi:TonB-dependent receptor [Janthinobacterium fluminis]|uniref:TonB-dependent receptor n=1 Tax=Janthinobacterium fluminis TaxID=2987524 RepID=A0ABT5K105_9BURK|nr:TonB-dependent receptor [Janthinobacterium fluminis]MDC8758657.1 TonB-dependent receptor [Janthinobacterium fluminis]